METTQLTKNDGSQSYDEAINSSSNSSKNGGNRKFRSRKRDTYKYGFLGYQPDCLQLFNRPAYFLFISSLVTFNFGFVSTGLNNTMLTSIEKRYGLKSTQIALFSAFQHLAAGLLATFVCYFGNRHRPVTIAIGCVFSAVGFFTISIPQYIVPIYKAGVVLVTDTCRSTTSNITAAEFPSSVTDCSGGNLSSDAGVENELDVLPIFLLGYALVGVGVTPLYALGAAHIDSITRRKESSLYFAIFAVTGFVGPAVGFLAGNPVLNIYVDLDQVCFQKTFFFLRIRQSHLTSAVGLIRGN